MDVLDLDCVAAVGARLALSDLACWSSCSTTIRRRVGSNQGLWSNRFATAFPDAFSACPCGAAAINDWPGAFRAAMGEATRLCTRDPWSVSFPRPLGADPPTVARLAVTRPPPGAAWSPPALAASLDQRLVFWRGDGGGELLCSDPQQGHTAFVDALLVVPAGMGPGYASGSRDQTIKLWTPFAGSCRTPAGLVRPARTLRGHTGSVSSLLALPSGGSGAALLASASVDKTVRLWSLACLLPGSSGPRGKCAGPPEGAQGAADDGDRFEGRARGSNARRRGGDGQQGRPLSPPPQQQQQQQQQQGRSPLLATLRGHSDGVTSLSPGPGPGGGGEGPCRLLSCGLDRRVKLWDLATQACVSTWRLPGPCRQLLDGSLLSASGCVAVAAPSCLTLLDCRAPGGGGGGSAPGALRLGLPSGSVAAAAAHGTTLAAGGRKGVRAWDVRAARDEGTASSSAAAASARSGAQCARLLFGAAMPGGAPVSALHVDRVKLVAATSRVALHSLASIAVWRLPDGQRVQQLSSTQAAIDLQVPLASMGAFGLDGEDTDRWELIHGMTEPDAAAAITLMHQQQHQQQQLVAAAAAAAAAAAEAAAAAPAAVGHGHAATAAAAAAVAALSTESGSGEHPAEAEDERGEEEEEEASRPSAAGGHWWQGGSSSPPSRGGSSGSSGGAEPGAAAQCSWGRVEPGVVAMAASGPVVAFVNTLGSVLLQDFSAGTPTARQMQPFSRGPVDASSGSPKASPAAAGEAAAAPPPPQPPLHKRDCGPDAHGAASADDGGSGAADDAALQPALGRFWRLSC